MKTLEEATHEIMNRDGSAASSLRIKAAAQRFKSLRDEALEMPELNRLMQAILMGFLEHEEPKRCLWEAFLTGLKIGMEMERQ